MSCLTNYIPSGPPCRQQTILLHDACGVVYISKGGHVGWLVARGSASGQMPSRSKPVEHYNGESAGAFEVCSVSQGDLPLPVSKERKAESGHSLTVYCAGVLIEDFFVL